MADEGAAGGVDLCGVLVSCDGRAQERGYSCSGKEKALHGVKVKQQLDA